MPYGKLNVLIVDDDDIDRKQIKRVLAQAGLLGMSTEAGSLNDALRACEDSAFDCAFVDYRMPGQDGLVAITALHERLPNMAIIMATGQGDEIVATEAMKHGALDYLPKSSIDVLSIRRITEGAVEKAALLKKVADQQEELANFASVLVHDLKAPIRSVILLSSMMKRDIEEGGNPGQVVEMCGVVNESARRMGELIEALFEYTKAEHRASFEPVAMERVVGDSLINLAATIQERGARITHDELPTVSGNSPQLIQLMQNLVGNSIKYCDKTPAIHVQARIHQEGVWLFSVRDNGIGIAEKYYRRIFEPFKRVCDTNKYEGSGLGLATCKKIVERHKGGIWCESREDYGTTFFFTLHGAASS